MKRQTRNGLIGGNTEVQDRLALLVAGSVLALPAILGAAEDDLWHDDAELRLRGPLPTGLQEGVAILVLGVKDLHAHRPGAHHQRGLGSETLRKEMRTSTRPLYPFGSQINRIAFRRGHREAVPDRDGVGAGDAGDLDRDADDDVSIVPEFRARCLRAVLQTIANRRGMKNHLAGRLVLYGEGDLQLLGLAAVFAGFRDHLHVQERHVRALADIFAAPQRAQLWTAGQVQLEPAGVSGCGAN